MFAFGRSVYNANSGRKLWNFGRNIQHLHQLNIFNSEIVERVGVGSLIGLLSEAEQRTIAEQNEVARAPIFYALAALVQPSLRENKDYKFYFKEITKL